MDYMVCCSLQRRLAEARAQGLVGDTLLLAQHPPTYCTGVLGKDDHVLLPPEELRRLGIPYYRSDRGGDVMFVGPGQVIGYAIVRLADLSLDPIRHLRLLEEVVLKALASFGVRGRRIPGLTGVWVEERKIAGVAVKVSRGVTTHGFNINLNPELSYFRHIVTCGNRGRGVASMQALLGWTPSREDVETCVVGAFEEVYGLQACVRRGDGPWRPY